LQLSVVGLGKLGLPLAAIHAGAGFKVFGIDQDKGRLAALLNKQCPILEPGLFELLERTWDNLVFASEIAFAVEQSDVTFIVVPTPSGKDNQFINDYVVAALEEIAPVLREKKGYHLVVVTSTVMPGSCANVFKPLLEQATGKVCGRDFGLCYNPEFIALGNVINGMVMPDAVLIGESDPKAGDILSSIYRVVCKNKPPIVRMDWSNAELAKLALNVYITAKISLANTFAEVCEALPGGDVGKVTGFIGLDSRIGRKYLSGGLGFAGPCFPRDNKAFGAFVHSLNVMCPIQKAVHSFNRWHNMNVVERMLPLLGDVYGKVVAILGVTYKPNTPIVEESPAIDMARWFSELKVADIKLYDPQGLPEARRVLGDMKRVSYCDDIPSCLVGADLCIIATPWDEIKALHAETFKTYMNTPIVYDCWRVMDGGVLESEGVTYYALGVNK